MTYYPVKCNSKSASKIYQDKNLHILICVPLIAVLAVASINPALPTLAKSLNVPPQQIGLVMTIYLMPVAIGTPVFGVLADRVGRKQILIPSLLLFAIAGTLSGFAQDFRTLLEWRFLQGIGGASLEALALAMIADLYAGKRLISAMAFNTTMIGISSIFYPLIGGTLAAFSWRYPFLISLCAVPIALLIATKLKLTKKKTSAVDFNLKAYLKTTWSGINNRLVLGLLLAVTSMFIMEFGACFVYIPFLAAVSLGAKSEVIGIILAGMSLSVAFFASQVGLFTRKISEITLLKIAFIVCGLALLTTPAIHNVWLLLIPTVLFGGAQGLALPITQAMLAGFAPEESRAGVMALNVTVQSLGRAIGPSLAGIAFGLWGMQGVFYACSILALATFVMLNFLLIPKR
jgi:MFS family permease